MIRMNSSATYRWIALWTLLLGLAAGCLQRDLPPEAPVAAEELSVAVETVDAVPRAATAGGDDAAPWDDEAERELKKIPFFVRGKARRNTERYARELGLASISLETLYDAKAHFAR